MTNCRGSGRLSPRLSAKPRPQHQRRPWRHTCGAAVNAAAVVAKRGAPAQRRQTGAYARQRRAALRTSTLRCSPWPRTRAAGRVSRCLTNRGIWHVQPRHTDAARSADPRSTRTRPPPGAAACSAPAERSSSSTSAIRASDHPASVGAWANPPRCGGPSVHGHALGASVLAGNGARIRPLGV